MQINQFIKKKKKKKKKKNLFKLIKMKEKLISFQSLDCSSKVIFSLGIPNSFAIISAVLL